MNQTEMVELVARELFDACVGGEMTEPPKIVQNDIMFSLEDGSSFKITVKKTCCNH